MNVHETRQDANLTASTAGVTSVRRAALRLNVGLTDASDTADILAVLDDLDAAEARVALLEGLLREAVDVLASVDGDGHRLKDRIEAVLADGG